MFPVTPRVPAIKVFPPLLTVKLPDPTFAVPEIATFEREVFPVTPNVPETAVLQPTLKLFVPVM